MILPKKILLVTFTYLIIFMMLLAVVVVFVLDKAIKWIKVRMMKREYIPSIILTILMVAILILFIWFVATNNGVVPLSMR